MADRIGRLRAALVGCGVNGIGRGTREGADLWFTHAGVYHDHPKVALVAAADLSPERLELCRRVWGVERLYRSAADLFEAERLDIVSICTPDAAHADVAIAATAAGVRAIFCEKPVATTVGDAERMVGYARTRGAILAVNHHRRWEAGHRDVRDHIRRGDIGDVLSARVTFTGGLTRVGTHAVDLLRYFFGDVSSVAAVPSPEGTVRARLGFPAGFEAELECWPRKGAPAFDLFEIDVIGARGRIQIAHFGAEIRLWTVVAGAEYGGDPELTREPAIIPSNMRAAFRQGLDALVAAMNGDRGTLASTGDDALAAVKVLASIDAQAAAQASTLPAAVPL